MIKLKRLINKPVLTPLKESNWQSAAVFNCAAIYDNNLFHLIYRATDIGPNKRYGNYISRLGYAVSKDGINFTRRLQPILSNDVEQELRGCEDPRIVKIDDIYYMMYIGFGGRYDEDYRICLATSKNLIDWKRHGIVLNEPNKDAALFPQKINGKYVMFHRRHPDIWIAFSDDLKNWYGHKRIIKPIEGSWESIRVGIAGPPIATKEGWFLIYHGADDNHVYRLGAALLDFNDPSKVIARQKEPILEPELEWEINGYTPNVVFSCGNAIKDGVIYVYYGGADTVIGVAALDMKDIKFE
ncbi:glycosidase [Aceticella autotrophica]|uniref:Glycosidase n=1 Tax=Aceticella autotrophica TaxID=2755338 RepID=A0A975GAR1_9THEO|nr:glycosidase [Aceticella autotrophica]QSZ27342.1 glycosidase [Aceticella autotrophica]